MVLALAEEHRVDVILLAENEVEPGRWLSELNANGLAEFHYAPSPGGSVITVFTRFAARFLRNVGDGSRYSIRELRLPGCVSVLVAIWHGPSLPRADKDSQILECSTVAGRVRENESKVGHERTLVVGDFNMDPFGSGDLLFSLDLEGVGE